MTDKKKRTLLVTVGALLCLALIVGIGSRFVGPPAAADPVSESGDPVSNTARGGHRTRAGRQPHRCKCR
jgi:hypothetical protein